MSKLTLNNLIKRHYWQTGENKCGCGCADRIYINSAGWNCVSKLKEQIKAVENAMGLKK